MIDHTTHVLFFFSVALLSGCGESKSPSGSSGAAATNATATGAAATSAAAAITAKNAASGDGAAGPPPASAGPSKSVVGECTFEFQSPGLPKHDPDNSGDLDQWINYKTHVVLALFRENKHAASAPRSV